MRKIEERGRHDVRARQTGLGGLPESSVHSPISCNLAVDRAVIYTPGKMSARAFSSKLRFTGLAFSAFLPARVHGNFCRVTSRNAPPGLARAHPGALSDLCQLITPLIIFGASDWPVKGLLHDWRERTTGSRRPPPLSCSCFGRISVLSGLSGVYFSF